MAIADFLFAAWLAWMTPLLAALSSARDAACSRASARLAVAGVGGLTEAAHGRLQGGLDRLVAQPRLLVGADAFDLRLDVGHAETTPNESDERYRGTRTNQQCADGTGYTLAAFAGSPAGCDEQPARDLP